jgi:hypothetical protein
MATPIAAGAAILARHYLENASFWGKYCDTTYRSCPSVVRSGYQHVSGALIKAVLVRWPSRLPVSHHLLRPIPEKECKPPLQPALFPPGI